ncbi:MAG: hypothetical protein LBT81_02845 [Helicobacteraceae bacterium]|jgi:hypothetical protein|nr:hypothetical protein [Helicobacteraceae bacterium]
MAETLKELLCSESEKLSQTLIRINAMRAEREHNKETLSKAQMTISILQRRIERLQFITRTNAAPRCE